MPFERLGLSPELLRAVSASGYTIPTPVQTESIPLVLAGRDLLAGAQTGTGKTAAFVLPILQILNAGRAEPSPQTPGNARRRGATGLPIRCLVLTPTRELALQIEESVRTYGSERRVRSTTIYGGVGFQPQVRALRDGPEIVVATPGRLLDHAQQGTIDLRSVEILVLDEADRMLDMGFIRDIRRILALIPAKRQNLLFSATFSDEIRELADTFLTDPAHVQIAARNAPIELVRQVAYPVDRERKRELLSHLIGEGRIDRALVFTRTKHAADRLAEQLGRDGISASAIHGNKSQSQRVHALEDFKAGRVAILVATEIAARGLDIDSLPHVVNFELPMVASDYVHRIGRTGRAGLQGDAVSLVCVDELRLLREIELLLHHPIPRETIEGFEVDKTIRAEPILQRSNGGRSMPGRSMPGRPMPGQPMAPRPTARPMAARPMDPRQMPARTMPAPQGYPTAQRYPVPQMAAQPRAEQPRAEQPNRPAQSGGGYTPMRRPVPTPPWATQAEARNGSRPDFRQPATGSRPQADSRPQGGSRRNAGRPGPGRPSGAPGTGFGNGRAAGTGFGNGRAAVPGAATGNWAPPQSRPRDVQSGGRNGPSSQIPGERLSRSERRAS